MSSEGRILPRPQPPEDPKFDSIQKTMIEEMVRIHRLSLAEADEATLRLTDTKFATICKEFAHARDFPQM